MSSPSQGGHSYYVDGYLILLGAHNAEIAALFSMARKGGQQA